MSHLCVLELSFRLKGTCFNVEKYASRYTLNFLSTKDILCRNFFSHHSSSPPPTQTLRPYRKSNLHCQWFALNGRKQTKALGKRVSTTSLRKYLATRVFMAFFSPSTKLIWIDATVINENKLIIKSMCSMRFCVDIGFNCGSNWRPNICVLFESFIWISMGISN